MKRTLLLLLLLLFLPSLSLLGQNTDGFTFTEIPKDLQLYPRDNLNQGTVLIDGQYNRSLGTQENYTKIRIDVKRNGSTYGNSPYVENLVYSGDIATFSFSIKIDAELADYSFIIRANDGDLDQITAVEDVVAGDVYVINGQSNAVASEQINSVIPDPQVDQFIRVYANGTTDDSDLQSNDNWYLAEGNGKYYVNGNVGQWGFKLGQMIVKNQDIPVAIFNGARGARWITYFSKDADPDSGEPTNNYQRLLYRLEKTKLRNHINAILWSQGENTRLVTSVSFYKTVFGEIIDDWNLDFNVDEPTTRIPVYVFQTVNGCGSPLEKLSWVKEAQRQLADENGEVQIMSTDGLVQVDNDDGFSFCHFDYSDGYEGFATRIYELVDNDLYSPNNKVDIEAPMITNAYLTGSTTLVVETSASSLTKGAYQNIFKLEGTTASIVQNNIQPFGNTIVFELDADPGNNASITNIGADPGVVNDFITNSRGIEIVSFLKYPISRNIFNIDDNLMFTQYYHDSTNNNNWLEVKNVSNTTVPTNVFFLNLFDNNTNAPTDIDAVPEIEPGEVLLYYKNGISPTNPNLGDADRIDSPVCNFDGSQVIVISTSFGNSAFADRIDKLGDSPGTLWGKDKSFIKKDDIIDPDINFEINNWINIDNSFVNDVSSTDSNITLGTHNTGSTSWNGSIWTNHIPGLTRTVTLSSDYNANEGTFYANDLTVTANLDFDEGTVNSVVVNGDLTISGGGQFTIGDQESLVMYKSDANINGDITKIENSTARNNLHDITYWSSSVISQDAVIGDVFEFVDPNRIFSYNQSSSIATDPSETTYWDVWKVAPSNKNMTAGVGFAAEGINDDVHNISFTGKPNNGDITVPIVFQDPGNDFNLIGNPYPSAIDISLFFIANDNVDAAHFWTHNTTISSGGDFTTDDYASMTRLGATKPAESGGNPPDVNIGSGQGFFIDVNDDSPGFITFTNDMRIPEANDQFFKSSISKKTLAVKAENEEDRIWLDLKTDEGGFSQILLGFKKGLTNNVDKGYDALKFEGGGNPISFYSIIDDKKFVIQGKRTFISLRKFNLGFDTDVAPRNFSVSVSRKEGVLRDSDVYLVDRLLKITHDLNESEYTFYQEDTGEFKDRFILKFEDSIVPEGENEDSNEFVIINGFNGYIAVKSNNKVIKVSVHDLYGNKLISARPNRFKFVVNTKNIAQGSILIFSATFENGEVINKKTIKF